jgi:hypothetical protein
VLSGGDEVPLLVDTSVAGLLCDGDEVLPEIASGGIDVEAEAGRGFDGDASEGASGGIISFIGFCGRGRVKNAARSGH